MKYYGNEPLIQGSMSYKLKPIRRAELDATLRDPTLKRGRPARPVRRIWPDGHSVTYESVAFAVKLTGENYWSIRAQIRDNKANKAGIRWEWLDKKITSNHC